MKLEKILESVDLHYDDTKQKVEAQAAVIKDLRKTVKEQIEIIDKQAEFNKENDESIEELKKTAVEQSLQLKQLAYEVQVLKAAYAKIYHDRREIRN